MTNKIIMIADDLTGACDAGVQFTQKGFKTVVCFEKESSDKIQADVIVLDTNSRALSSKEAYSAVKQTVSEISNEDLSLVYKKIDSTLRGNLGTEIDALMDNHSFDFAVIAPALPSLGRTTKNGVQYLKGAPVDKTEIANDPKTPVTESNIIKLVSSQSERAASLLPKSFLQEDIVGIQEQVKDHLKNRVSLFVCDAECETELKEIAAVFSSLPYKILWVGSAGLAEWLTASFGKKKNNTMNHQLEKGILPVLVVAGSRSGVSKSQVDTLLRLADIRQVQLSIDMLADKQSRDSEIYRCESELTDYLKKGHDVVLYVNQGNSAAKPSELPSLIEGCLSKIVSGVSSDIKLNGIVLTGGDTAKAICKELGVTGIELIDEIENGMPLSRMIGGPENLTVTKAGAFGSETSLYHALIRLKGD